MCDRSPPIRRRVADDPTLAPSLAMVLDRAFTPSRHPSRGDLLWAAMNVWAPTEVVSAIAGLPDKVFWSHSDVEEMAYVGGTAPE